MVATPRSGRVSSGLRQAVGHPSLVILSGGWAAISEASAVRGWLEQDWPGQAGGGDVLATLNLAQLGIDFLTRFCPILAELKCRTGWQCERHRTGFTRAEAAEELVVDTAPRR